MTDWGVHEIDIALYAMNAEAPISVVASGGKLAYPDDPAETPDTLQAIFQYENFNMLWEHATGIDTGPYGRREGIAFIGNNGTLVVDRGGYDIIEEYEALSSECGHFIQSIQGKTTPRSDGMSGLRVIRIIEAANQSLREEGRAIPVEPISNMETISNGVGSAH